MRDYKHKALTDGSEFEDYTIKLYPDETKEYILQELKSHSEDSVYWGKEINGEIFYSNDEVFNT